MKKNYLTAMVATALLSLSTVQASATSQLPTHLGYYDLNGDGKVSVSEIQTAKTNAFKVADTDQNDFLSWAEYKALSNANKQKHVEISFHTMDTDMSMDVSIDEYANAYSNMPNLQADEAFMLISGDDQQLTFDEFSALHSTDLQKQVWRFVALDTVIDGQLSLEEYLEVRPKHYNRGNIEVYRQ